MFEITLFGIFAFGILVCLVATWLRSWRFTESVGVGLVAVALGALCLPGLRLLTQQVKPPYQTGSALLFASGQPDQSLQLFVTVSGVQETSQSESFQVRNLSKHPIRWVLLIVGGARMHRYWIDPGVRVNDLAAAGSYLNTPDTTAPSQIFYGSLGAGATVFVNGISAERFADSNSHETGVTLPSYGEGFISELSPATKTAVINTLGEQPTVRRRSLFTTRVVTTPIFPDDTVTSPGLNPSDAPPDALEWKVHDPYPLDFTITNQQAAEAVSNFMFAFAILLGVAGAGVMASLQGAIHASAVPPKLNSDDHE
jgi:hypothetical protein